MHLRPAIFSSSILAGCLLALASACDSQKPGAPAASPAPASSRVHPAEVRGAVTFAHRPAPPGSKPVPGGTVVLSLLSDIDSFNPFTSSSAEASEIHDLIFPRLMQEQPDYYKGPPTFEPVIAESWTPGSDGLSIRFKLRECRWSDGTPITSGDVRFSWEAARNPDVAWVSASIVDFIQDIEIHSDREFTVRYSRWSPYQLMDINDVQILPRHTLASVPFKDWQGYGRWFDLAKLATGGPFVLGEFEPNQRVVLERNPRYWEPDRPYLDRVVFRIIRDMRTQLNTLISGDIDCMRSVLPEKARQVLDTGQLMLYTYVTRSYGYIGWNCKAWPFADHRVRQAMTHAIDRENIVESILYGYGKVAAPHIISSFWASNEKIEPLPYDPDRAIALLEEAGWKKNARGLFERDGKPFRFTIKTNSGNPIRKRICEFVQSNLKDIGVEVEIQLMDFNQMSTQFKEHKFQAYVGGWYVATKVDFKNIWHSSAARGRFNHVDYANPRVDEIIDRARVLGDPDEAKPLWDEFQEILHRDQPYTMVYEPRGLVAVHKRFRNVRVTSLRAYDNLDEWWVPESERRFK